MSGASDVGLRVTANSGIVFLLPLAVDSTRRTVTGGALGLILPTFSVVQLH